MSSKELRIEMKSSLFSKISEVDYDSSGAVELSDTNFLESVIENVGNKVVSNGASIETLKSKSVGISSCVTSIQDALDSNSDSDISTKILEMHKTKKAVRETIRGGGINFSSSISSHISTRRSILNFNNYSFRKYTPSIAYVSSSSGTDSRQTSGSINDPYKTLAGALTHMPSRTTRTIRLREGYYLSLIHI